MSRKYKQPVSYAEVLRTVEFNPERTQEKLFVFEITNMAKHIKHKLSDTRSIPELMDVIVTELLAGKWDYKKYLCSLHYREAA